MVFRNGSHEKTELAINGNWENWIARGKKMKVKQNFRQGKPIHQKHRVWNKQHVLFVWCLFFYTINIYRVPIRNPALFQGVGDSSLKINHCSPRS